MNQAEFEQHVRTGERNKVVLELMHNWCAHARARNHGGTGLIAIQTGLPLGMYAMECDYAPAGGMAGWFIEAGVLDFYDRNCVHCNMRQAVRLPNLIQLVGERDRNIERQRVASDRAAAEAEAARVARKRRRDALRVGQSVATCSLLDDLEALDVTPTDDARTKIVETAKLAPEVLTPPVQEYFFELASSPSAGCQAEALQALQNSSADAKRLMATAFQCLARGDAIRTAAGIVMTNPELADEASVEAAVPALIWLARPPRSPFGDDRRELYPAPLEVIYDAWPDAVIRGIESRLDSRQSYAVRSGTAGLKVLSRTRPALLIWFAKTLVAKLARAHLLIDDEESDRNLDDVCLDLQRAIAAAFLYDPVATDRYIEDYFVGASSEGEARLARAFHDVFRLAARDEIALTEEVVATALARIVRLASTSTNFSVLNEVVQILRGKPEEVVSAVRKNLDAVLGAAAVLDDRLETFEAEQKKRTGISMLDALEARNSRSTLYYLREAFAALAAKAASGHRSGTESYVDFLSRIGELRTGLSSALIKESNRLISTPEGLNLVLPQLYTALVGSSTLLRATAAETLGRAGSLRIADLPELVLEAFVLLLFDRYVIVHKAAAKALESVSLSPHLDTSANLALLHLINAYKSDGDDKEFLARCIGLYCSRYAAAAQLKRSIAVTFIRILESVPASSNIREINRAAKHLQSHPEFVDLVISCFDDENVSEYGEEEVMTLVYRIPDGEVFNRAGDLANLAIRQGVRATYVAAIVEVLTRAGAWQQAIAAMEASWSQVPDTVPMRRLKWGCRMHLIAVQFESAVVYGDVPKQMALKDEWEALEAKLQEDEILYAERRNPLPSFFRPNQGG